MRRIVAGIYDPLPTPTTVGSRGVTKVAFQNLFREISGLSARGEKKKRERERGKKKRRRRREKKIACSRLWSRARPECRAFLLESRKWTTLAKLPATRHRASVFPFFFPSTDSFPRPRGTANGAWMSWMSCLPAETPDVLNATSNIDTRRSLGQDAWPLLSFPSCLLACLLSFGHIRIRGCGGGWSRVMWLGTLGEEFWRWWSLEMWIDVM